MSIRSDKRRIHAFFPFIAAAVILTTFYWLTAPRTITWWEGSSWPLIVATLGVTGPPGSLILTVLGWLVTKIPLGVSTALRLNLFAGVISVAMLGILYMIILNIKHHLWAEQVDRRGMNLPAAIAIASSLVTLGLSFTVWRYSVKITPYILTGLFTAALIWAMFRWWKEAESIKAIRWLFLICLLFGLDFSVHRTNLLILPGFIVWVLLRNPSTLTQGRNWFAALFGLLLGLSVHFLLIPLAARGPAVNFGDPSTLSRFYDYVLLRQFGGGWLVNLLRRKGPFLEYQFADYIRTFLANFSNISGKPGLIGVLPLVGGLFGMIVVWRAQRRLAIGLLILFLLTSLGAVVYFNLPVEFPWPMDRHYIPSFLIFGLFMILGMIAIVRLITRNISRFKRLLMIVAVLIMLVMPAAQFAGNLDKVDASSDRFAHDYAGNILSTVEPDAFLFVQGDNIWPLWYLQSVEGIRPDMSIIGPSLMNTSWYVRQLTMQSPELPIALTRDELETIPMIAWPRDTIVTVIVESRSNNEWRIDAAPPPDSVHFHIPASIMDCALLAQDWLLLRLIVENRWQRPIYFTQVPGWLKEHCRLEGLVSKLMPVDSAVMDCPLLWRNLMESYRYTGYADVSGPRDWITEAMARNYIGAFSTLAECERAVGDTANAAQARDRMQAIFPYYLEAAVR